MRKAYIFVYNPSLGSREEVKKFVEDCKLIKVWRFELEGCFFLVSEASANEICEELHKHFGEGKGKFIISEMSENSQGWLAERSWTIINEKRLPPRKKS